MENIFTIKNKILDFPFLEEVNEDSTINECGIYMLYIDFFGDNSILPIYIGKSKDVQKRFDSHLKKIMFLNRLSESTYLSYFFEREDPFYDGSFLYCKIFQYMIDHQCTLTDFKMKVVEFCSLEELESKELYYINYFKSQFVGFNQLNSRTLLNAIQPSICNPKENRDIINKYFQEYFWELDTISYYLQENTGYTSFNYNYTFLTILPIIKKIFENMDESYSDYRENNLEKRYSIRPSQEIILQLKEKLTTYRQLSRGHSYALEGIKENIKKIIRKSSSKRLKSEVLSQAYQDYITTGQVSNIPHINLEELKNNSNLFLKEHSKVKKEKQEYDKLISEQISQIVTLKKPLLELILPHKNFHPFELGHREIRYYAAPIPIENTVYIDFISNTYGKSKSSFFSDLAYVVSVRVTQTNKNDIIDTVEYIIKNVLTDEIQSGFTYVEKDIMIAPLFRKIPFQPILAYPNGHLSTTMITLSVEKNTGLNDSVIQNATLIPLEEIIAKLESSTNVDTQFIINSNVGSKLLFEAFSSSLDSEQLFDILQNEDAPNTLLEKIYSKIKKSKQRTIFINKRAKQRTVKLTPKTVVKNHSQKSSVEKRRQRYLDKVFSKNPNIQVLEYIDSKTPVHYKCCQCQFEWKARSDKIFIRPYCKNCKSIPIDKN